MYINANGHIYLLYVGHASNYINVIVKKQCLSPVIVREPLK